MALFNWLSAKPDHPLASAGEARRIADEISRREPREAVDDASAWLESLDTAEGFSLDLLAERLLLIEAAAVPQVRRLGRDYLAGLAQENSEGSTAGSASGNLASRALWQSAHDFWARLASSYMHCLQRYQTEPDGAGLSKDLAALLHVAGLHAWAALQKWQQFRYRRMPDSFWTTVGGIFLSADAKKLSQRKVELYASHGQTTAAAEYLKILLFHVAAMDTLPPLEIELGERLIAHFLPAFALTREARPDNVYWVDVAQPMPPARLARVPEATPGLHFFNGAPALAALSALNERIKSFSEVPAEVNLGGQYAADSVSRVLDHLAMCWAAKPPVRSHVRRAITAPMALIYGFREGLQTLAYARSEMRTRIPDLELWTVLDVSLGGFAIHGTVGRDPWPGIGVLVTMKADGDGSWLVGVIRRFSRAPVDETVATGSASLGIETLSRSAAALVADADGFSLDAIVLDLPVVGECCRLLVPPGTIEPTIPLRFVLDDKSARLMPRETIEVGPDYALVNFFVQSFS